MTNLKLNPFTYAKWIWQNNGNGGDEYGEFCEILDFSNEDLNIHISCHTNYALYVNGMLASFGQYADFPWYKVYDDVNITQFLKNGKNEIRIIVWHLGNDCSFTSYPANPRLVYEVQDNSGKAVAFSSEKTLCRPARGYVPYLKKKISSQLGYSFRFDTGASEENMDTAVVVSQVTEKLFPRPVKNLLLGDIKPAVLLDDKLRLYDLGEESVGFLYIRFSAPKGQVVTVSFGEHIVDGGVRRIIHSRDFSVEIVGSGKTEEYLNPFRRLGCRYLQINGEAEIETIGIRETLYPVEEKPFETDNPLRKRIYDISVRTLRLCMHEHYEDTPWREQSFYAFDSRNQMLFGSQAFCGHEFQRASLKLLSENRRSDNLLPICTPCSVNLTIPSFSLWYIVAMCEYAQYSKDLSLAEEYLSKMADILKVFCDRKENGLIRNFRGIEGYWDFYEWSKGLGGNLDKSFAPDDAYIFEAPLQFIVSIALQSMSAVCSMLNKSNQAKYYSEYARELNKTAAAVFYRSERGLFDTFGNGKHYAEFVNALGVVCGAANCIQAEQICQCLAFDKELIQSTLSTKCFTFDALLKIDREKYSQHIMKEIDSIFGAMLSSGATSFWETKYGEKDFFGAGSLCHGWSALPAYYYRII